jgi:hypothetical protein
MGLPFLGRVRWVGARLSAIDRKPTDGGRTPSEDVPARTGTQGEFVVFGARMVNENLRAPGKPGNSAKRQS